MLAEKRGGHPDFGGRRLESPGEARLLKRASYWMPHGLEEPAFIYELAEGVVGKLSEIDAILVKTAPEWPLEQITLVDRNVLRVGIYELMFLKDVPPKVAINEAVEMAKTFGGETSGKFVNGVMGTLYKQVSPQDEQTPALLDMTPNTQSAEPSSSKSHPPTSPTSNQV